MRLYNVLFFEETFSTFTITNLMGDKFKNKFRISSARLTGWDYGSNGLYYITICTKNRVHYFGDIISTQNVETHNHASPQDISIGTETYNHASLQPTLIGQTAHNNWLDIPNHFPFVELDDFVVMPNHLHGILYINKPDKTDWQPNKFGSQSQNLASIIRNYKGSVKTHATINNIEFAWQPRYYDRIIRNEKEYANVREYIFNNPENWLLNGDNADNLYP
jgi:REP-associated tyrosine transposase